MKKCFIFFDNDGVTSQWNTWGNDIFLAEINKDIKDIDIYKWNFLDHVCRRLNEDIEVYAVCISSWKYVFYDEINRNDFTRFANLKRIKIFDDPEIRHDRMSYREPMTRIDTIRSYLEKYKPDNYIILDDEFDREYESLGFNYIKTPMYDGIDYTTMRQKVAPIIESWGLKQEVIEYEKKRAEGLKMLLGCAI